MAEINFSSMTSNQKVGLYAALFKINRSVRFIVFGLEDLKQLGIFNIESLRTFQRLTRELQSEINTHLLAIVHDVEMKDAYIHGKARIARENLLNPERIQSHS